jgi:Uma2 family endonuclease
MDHRKRPVKDTEAASISLEPGERLLLHDISWERYEELLEELSEHRWRIAYDEGRLEIMSPSSRNESIKKLIGRLVEALTEELDIDILSAGSMTCKRKDKRKAVEADECYYVSNEPAVRAKEDFGLPEDPPPDLAIEADLYSSSLNKFNIYSAIGVGELWCYRKGKIDVYLLQSDASYSQSAGSSLFPFLPMEELERFLKLRSTISETRLVRSFREWVRASLKR